MITSGQVAVGTTRVQIDGTSVSSFRLQIHNMDNSDAIYIGGPDVTISNGLAVQKLESIQLDCFPSETVFVVSPKDGHLISYLRQV